MEHELIIATWIIAGAAISTAGGTLVFNYKQNQTSKKHIEYMAMLEVMKIFNSDKNAVRRESIYFAYAHDKLYDANNDIWQENLRYDVASIRGTCEQMGQLVKGKYVKKDEFLKMYAESVIKMYKVLKNHIDRERKNRGSNDFSSIFEEIFNDARAYWKEEHPNDPEPEPYKIHNKAS